MSEKPLGTNAVKTIKELIDGRSCIIRVKGTLEQLRNGYELTVLNPYDLEQRLQDKEGVYTSFLLLFDAENADLAKTEAYLNNLVRVANVTKEGGYAFLSVLTASDNSEIGIRINLATGRLIRAWYNTGGGTTTTDAEIFKFVDTLPDKGQPNKIYLVPKHPREKEIGMVASIGNEVLNDSDTQNGIVLDGWQFYQISDTQFERVFTIEEGPLKFYIAYFGMYLVPGHIDSEDNEPVINEKDDIIQGETIDFTGTFASAGSYDHRWSIPNWDGGNLKVTLDIEKYQIKIAKVEEHHNVYCEYIWADGTWELIGESPLNIDLGEYDTKIKLLESAQPYIFAFGVYPENGIGELDTLIMEELKKAIRSLQPIGIHYFSDNITVWAVSQRVEDTHIVLCIGNHEQTGLSVMKIANDGNFVIS